MKHTVLFSLLLILLSFLLPLLLRLELPAADETGGAVQDTPQMEIREDEALTLTVKAGEEVREMSMAEYLAGALAGEMPASFESEALKAQAVALRSYACCLHARRKSAHPEADICTDPGCCASFVSEGQRRENWGDRYAGYSEKLDAAIRDTDGQVLLWEGESVLAVFHSSSQGATAAGDKPYLLSVSTPETETEVSGLVTTVEVLPEDFAASFRSLRPGAALDGDPGDWAVQIDRARDGRVNSLTAGGETVTAQAVRALFSLRSTDFELDFDQGRFVFTVHGYGHGQGMSQYGANLMAQRGESCRDILAHYYPGTVLGSAESVFFPLALAE